MDRIHILATADLGQPGALCAVIGVNGASYVG
jgi:hypothetical protein